MVSGTATNDYGTASGRSGLVRPAILATQAFHWVSSMIVMGISAYFINNYPHNTHLRYWVSVAAIDSILYLPAIALPVVKRYKGHLAPLAWIFSYLWLTAFIFAVQDYEYNGGPLANSPVGVNKPAMKKTILAFSFLAFFTNLVGFGLEAGLYDSQRFKNKSPVVTDKTHSATAADNTVGPTGPAV